MNEAISQKWIQELESGRWKKGISKLHRRAGEGDHSTEDSFCCLGVLCRMALDAGVSLDVRNDQDAEDYGERQVKYDGNTGELPEKVMDWAGIQTALGELPQEEPGVGNDLTLINDRNTDFKEVVEAIREYWNEL